VIAKRVSRLYPRHLRSYVYWKVRSDPAYGAVLDHLRGRETEPVLDLGCGIGLLALLLRERGFSGPITGIDIDERKIAIARRIGRDVEFIRGSAAGPLPPNRNVVLLDLLQYLDTPSQGQILANVARAVPPGGVVVIRQGIRDGSWRYKLTKFVDNIGRAIRWNRGGRMNFPAREEILRHFDGFRIETMPLRGKLPYNNYLFVLTRPAAARPAESRTSTPAP
jgi:SAM-dependent methyltransferase